MEQPSFITILSVTTLILIIATNVAKLKHETHGRWSWLSLSPLVIVMFVLVTIPSIVAIPIFWTYKHLIQFYLKIKHRKKFVGMIEGSDVTYASNDKNDSIITSLFMYEVSAEKSPDDVFKSLKSVINKHFVGNKDKLSKFHCVLRSCSGYMYMLKQDINQDDCVRKMKNEGDKEEITKEELMKLVNEYKDAKFLKNDQLLWDVIIGTQPVQWKAKAGVKYYPTMFRLHHAISDGFSFSEFIFGVASDKSDNHITREAYISKTRPASFQSRIFHNVVISLYSIIYSPTMLVMEQVVNRKEHHILHGPKLNKVSVFSAKFDDGEYFKKIKCIKSYIRGANFSDILFAALSFGLHQYYEKRSAAQPKYIHLVVPFLRKTMHLPQLPVGCLNVEDINLQNTFDLLNLELPVVIQNYNELLPFQQRLKAIQKHTKKMEESTTNKVLHFATHLLLQILPQRMMRYVINTLEWAAIVSILPAPGSATMANGLLTLKNVVCWIPRMKGIGCNFSMISYDNKLQLGLNVDSALIAKEADAEFILDGVFKYLDLLEKEINVNK